MLTRLTQFDFYPVIGDTQGPAVVLFSAEACGSCRYWKQFLQSYGAAHPELTQEFELFHLPALFLFVDGEYHAALHCEPNEAAFAALLVRLQQCPAEEAP